MTLYSIFNGDEANLDSPIIDEPASTLVEMQDYSSPNGVRFVEVAGGTMTKCAVVCYCCPCSVINLLVLGLYNVLRGLKERSLIQGRSSNQRSSYDRVEFSIHPMAEMEKRQCLVTCTICDNFLFNREKL